MITREQAVKVSRVLLLDSVIGILLVALGIMIDKGIHALATTHVVLSSMAAGLIGLTAGEALRRWLATNTDLDIPTYT